MVFPSHMQFKIQFKCYKDSQVKCSKLKLLLFRISNCCLFCSFWRVFGVGVFSSLFGLMPLLSQSPKCIFNLSLDNPTLIEREVQLPKYIYYNTGCYEFCNDLGVEGKHRGEESFI